MVQSGVVAMARGPRSMTQAGVQEYYRHRHRSNVLWLDGHVEALDESLGDDVKPEWYVPPDLSAY